MVCVCDLGLERTLTKRLTHASLTNLTEDCGILVSNARDLMSQNHRYERLLAILIYRLSGYAV